MRPAPDKIRAVRPLQLAGVTVLAVTVAGCGAAARPSAVQSPAAQAAPSSGTGLDTATIYAQDHDAQIVISPGDQGETDLLIKDLASGGTFWSYTPNGQSVSSLQQACDLTSPNGAYEMVVLDDPGGFIGQDVCTGAASYGWTASKTPGPLAQQIAQEQAQAAQASATASAASAQAQNVSQAQQSLASDVSTLQSDSSSLNNDNSLAGDVKSMQTDYATEQADYRTEQADTCDSMGGDAGTVGGDAGTVGGDLGSLNGDVQTLQSGGIQSVKTDISNIQKDLSTLQGLGAPPGTDSSAAVVAGNQALKSAANAISWANQQGNSINSQAQQLASTAQAYASSHCG
jgi:hypothetical protein